MSTLRSDNIVGRDQQSSPNFPKGAVVIGVATATTFKGNLEGNVTGDVSGNTSTSTTLQNSRTIGGVAFDGSANIDLPGVNQVGNQNTAGTAAGVHGTPSIVVQDITGVGATFTGNVSIGGTLTYEDVTNIDSVGVITARNGISVTGGSVDINENIKHVGDLDTKIGFPAADTFAVTTANNERARFTSDGKILIGTNTPFSTTGYRRVQIGQADGGWINLARTGVPADGNHLGAVQGFIKSADGNYHPAAAIDFKADGAAQNSSKPSRIEFYTTPSSATTSAERLRIANNGAFGIGGGNYGTSGQVLTSGGSGAPPQWADAAGGGKVAQVKMTSSDTGLDSTSADHDLISCTITPTATTSNILVMTSFFYGGNMNPNGGFRITRGGTVVEGSDTSGTYGGAVGTFWSWDDCGGTTHSMNAGSFNFLDTGPSGNGVNTTSAVTYKLEAHSFSRILFNRAESSGNARSTLILMEITA